MGDALKTLLLSISPDFRTCYELKCVCYACPIGSQCEQHRCPGRISHPHCEGYYVCNLRERERRYLPDAEADVMEDYGR